MVHAKNYETVSTLVKVMQKKLWPVFFPDTVYISQYTESLCQLLKTHFLIKFLRS